MPPRQLISSYKIQGATMTITADHTISQLFLLSNAQQRADIVNRLLSNVSHEMVVSLAASIGDFGDDQHPRVTPEQTEKITAAQMEEIAATAEQHAPGVVEKV